MCSAEIHRKLDTEIHAGHMYLFIEAKRAQHGSKNKKSFFRRRESDKLYFPYFPYSLATYVRVHAATADILDELESERGWGEK